LLVIGGDPSGGSSSAKQDVSNKADADASNKSNTDQDATGHAGRRRQHVLVRLWRQRPGAETSSRSARTKQDADADAKAKQNAVNANAPESILGTGLSGSGSRLGGPDGARNSADADASTRATTDQGRNRDPEAGKSECWSGCAAMARSRNVVQIGETKQDADADAKAKQNAVNANVPLLVVGGDPSLGSSSASQDVSNKAECRCVQPQQHDQDTTATQSGGGSKCWSGCGGNGQEQNVIQIGRDQAGRRR